MIYLDNAATSLHKPSCVYKSFFKYSKENSANAGRGGHRYALRASEMVYDASEAVATLFGIEQPERIAFTCNTTMALNMAIHGVCAPSGHIVITSMEHNSVLRPVFYTGCSYTVVQADAFGYVEPTAIERAIREDTRLIVVNHVSNVCGQVQAIEEIGKIAKAHGVLFLVDAAQSAGVAEIDVSRQAIDMLAFAGHKSLMGPLGTGGLYVAEGVDIRPILQGGSGSASERLEQPSEMPDLLVSGTVNAPAIAALGESVRFILRQGKGALLAHERSLADAFCLRLREMEKIELYCGNGNGSGVVSLNIQGRNPADVSRQLDEAFGIAVRSGLHCAPLAHKTLGTFDAGTVRFSFGFFNTLRDVEKAADAIYKLTKEA